MISRSRNLVRLTFAATLIGVLGAASPAEPAQPGHPRPLVHDVTASAPLVEVTPHVVRSRRVGVDAGLVGTDPVGGERVLLPLFDDATFTGVVSRVQHRSATSRVWYGTLDGIAHGSFIVVVEPEVVLANVWAPGVGNFHLRTLPDGSAVIREIDGSAFPRCGMHLGPDAGRAERAAAGAAAGGACGDDGSVIDLLVVYTEAARVANGGTPAIEALITMAEAATNEAYLNSGIATTVQVVGTQEVVYTESGSGSTDRAALTDPNDGQMDEVHDLRDQLAADVVTLLVDSLPGLCGIAHFSIQAGNIPVPSLGFNVVRWDCAVDNETFAHELGHNQGSRHDRAADNSDDGAFLYSHGFKEPGGNFRTVMAVFDAVVPRIRYFSNPTVLFGGLPTGIAAGQPDSADNAQSIDGTAFNVANFRQSVPQDCNNNGVTDADDIINGTSEDVNDNGVPDECESGVLYVDAAAVGAANGLTWADAFTDLQDALDAPVSSCSGVSEIWVAAGTYTPDRGTGDRSDVFQLRTGLALYGGFAGGETDRDDRDSVANPTVLSGDLDGDDLPGFVNNAENSYTVVEGGGTDASAVLDGFVVSGGNADGALPEDRGAGLACFGGSPTISDCRFSSNSAGFLGGGMELGGLAAPLLTRCVFSDNEAFWGAGLYSNNSSPELVDCLFLDNHASIRGAAFYGTIDAPTFINCVFTGNTSGGDAGGLYFVGDIATMVNCTVAGNTAITGGGVYSDGTASVNLSSCILWQNGDNGGTDESAQIQVDPGASATPNYCCIEGLTGGLGGVGNIGLDPLFVSLVGRDLDLSAGSPCIDAGDNGQLPPGLIADIAGRLRQFDDPATVDTGNGAPPVVDMGAFEFGSPPLQGRLYVDADMLVSGVGLSWDSAFATLQEALDAAAAMTFGPVDAIWVADGVYVPDTESNPGEPRSVTFQLADGLAVYGGFDGTEATLAERAGLFDLTILSGDVLGDDLPGFVNETENAHHVVLAADVDAGARLDGFTVTGGNSDGPCCDDNRGAGLRIVDGSPRVANCRFVANHAQVGSGGFGAGVHHDGGDPTFVRCIFGGNVAKQGGGVSMGNGTADFVNCLFVANQAFAGNGGALHVSLGSTATFTNCLFEANDATAGGGGALLLALASDVTLSNCTLVGNLASGIAGMGGGMRLTGSSTATFANCILWNSSDSTGMGEGGADQRRGRKLRSRRILLRGGSDGRPRRNGQHRSRSALRRRRHQ